MKAEKQLKGTIIQLQDFSVHDGDGIRTTIFFAGCPLRCSWCSNPESWTQEKKLAFFQDKCRDCGQCEQVCPRGLRQGREPKGGVPEAGLPRRVAAECVLIQGALKTGRAEDRVCHLCGRCAAQCPQGALNVMGETMTVDEVEAQILRDSLFYGLSGGGVTFSGGEATVQAQFLRRLAGRLYDRGISMWLETCGVFPFDDVKDILLKLDHIFFDLKHMDSRVHRELTGIGNEEILENCRRLYALGIPMTLRIPCIPKANMTEENLIAAAGFIAQQLPSAQLELLPYHGYGVQKYKALRLGEPAEFTAPSEADMEWAGKKQSIHQHASFSLPTW